MTQSTHDSDDKARIFGPYEVHERLGVGGMATVHRAVHLSPDGTEQVVALKRLLPHLAEDEAFVKAFVREAKLSSLLLHPNIVALHELGRVAETYFMAMEFVDGRDLRKCLRQARRAAGPPPLTVVLSIAREICDALDYAHKLVDERGRRLGLVHRDISPSNILISGAGSVKLIDFGIAKATAQQATRTGTIKGKLAYMAPESLGGEPDARADLFSLGVVLHELLTARPLFADKNDFKVIRNIETMSPPAPSRFNAKCPRELDAFVLKALEKRREDRWVSSAAMCDAIDQICHEYKLHPSSRDVFEWVEWAFALPVPDRKQAKFSESDSSVSSVSFTSSPGTGPTGIELPGEVTSFLEGAPGEVIPSACGPVDPADELSDAVWGDGATTDEDQVALLTDVPELTAASDPDEEAATVAFAKQPGALSVESQAILAKLSPAPTAPGSGRNPADLGLVTFRPPTRPPPIALAAPPVRSPTPRGMPPLPIVAADAEPPVLLEIRRPAAPTGGGVRRPTEELPAYDLTSASPGISRLKLSLLYVLLIAIAIILGIAIASSL